MNDFIWHNPRCSKSRQSLQLIQDAGLQITIIDYLTQPPTATELAQACAGLGCRPQDILRSKEALFEELELSLDDARSAAQWCQILSDHPRLLERPIVCIGGRYALGRPPESVKALF